MSEKTETLVYISTLEEEGRSRKSTAAREAKEKCTESRPGIQRPQYAYQMICCCVYRIQIQINNRRYGVCTCIHLYAYKTSSLQSRK